ncbi:MAG: aminotransferase class V-fold PLP-dependent enzyme, partial [Pseudonocardiaceae bacterium]
PFAALAGVSAAVEHLAVMDDTAVGTRRERLAVSRCAAVAHEAALGTRMVAGLRATPGVTVHGEPAQRTPTAYFTLAGHSPADLAEALSSRGINCWHGYSYAWELAGALGLREGGGAVRTSISHYNTAADVDRLLNAVTDLAAGSPTGH